MTIVLCLCRQNLAYLKFYGKNHPDPLLTPLCFCMQNHLECEKRVEYFDKDLVEKLDRRLLKLYNDLNKIVVTLKSSEK